MKQLFILVLIFATTNLAVSQTKTVTNGDLEQFRQKRLKAEKDYRENYEKLGFPSPEELERQNAESRRQLSELARRIEAENTQNRNYYKAQANALLAEIAAVDAQIAYLRGEVNRLPSRNYIYSYGYAPYFYRQRQPIDPNYIQPLPNLANNQILINQYPYRNNHPAPIYNRRHYYPRGYIVPTIIDDNSYQRSDVVSQLRYLERQRAGLLAEWRILEEEAHKVGVKIN
ncbi:MAG: hypothetical protein M3Q33_12660 [Acidobacteriota bacterium]|nr:hypothetical protein [Acidobacteriota bacterium]